MLKPLGRLIVVLHTLAQDHQGRQSSSSTCQRNLQIKTMPRSIEHLSDHGNVQGPHQQLLQSSDHHRQQRSAAAPALLMKCQAMMKLGRQQVRQQVPAPGMLAER